MYREQIENTKKIRFEAPSWKQLYHMLLELADGLSLDKPEVIIGVARGGLVPARIISDLLGNVELGVVGVGFYTNIAETKEQPNITMGISTTVKDKKVLIIDDVADTGQSLQTVKNYLTTLGAKEVKTATIYYKPWSTIKPNFYARKSRKWIIFPWETRETILFILDKNKNLPEEEQMAELYRTGIPEKVIKKILKRNHESLTRPSYSGETITL
jgi:hypothetical protein